jgi:hypothetical protein
MRRQRPRRRAAEKRDEVASSYGEHGDFLPDTLTGLFGLAHAQSTADKSLGQI